MCHHAWAFWASENGKDFWYCWKCQSVAVRSKGSEMPEAKKFIIHIAVEVNEVDKYGQTDGVSVIRYTKKITPKDLTELGQMFQILDENLK